ncbi:hypothetical protein KIPB_011404 [Kipferlia bialata]|uniref:Uncharacterized protein n=1 Tax=Kipferlia bialata TaxID=797122 RepID=A0A391NQH4_9EUKA|nr:hypothetical protein KIPB_011404 [Kipferlia bialata]|eukprot:g11404.t1
MDNGSGGRMSPLHDPHISGASRSSMSPDPSSSGILSRSSMGDLSPMLAPLPGPQVSGSLLMAARLLEKKGSLSREGGGAVPQFNQGQDRPAHSRVSRRRHSMMQAW